MTLPIALFLAVTAAAPRVAVVVHATGLGDDDVRRLQDKVGAEVNGAGAETWALSKSLEVKTECLVDRNCAREVLHAADAAFLVWIEALRAGGQLQLECHLLDGDGRPIAEAENAARADDVLGAGLTLPKAIVDPLKAAVTRSSTTTAAATTAPPTTTTTTPPVAATTGPAPLAPDSAPAQPPTALSPLAVGGIAGIGAGALMIIGGSSLGASQLGVIRDPASLGAQKQSAATLAGTMFVIAGLGVVVAGAGGALLYFGL